MGWGRKVAFTRFTMSASALRSGSGAERKLDLVMLANLIY